MIAIRLLLNASLALVRFQPRQVIVSLAWASVRRRECRADAGKQRSSKSNDPSVKWVIWMAILCGGLTLSGCADRRAFLTADPWFKRAPGFAAD